MPQPTKPTHRCLYEVQAISRLTKNVFLHPSVYPTFVICLYNMISYVHKHFACHYRNVLKYLRNIWNINIWYCARAEMLQFGLRLSEDRLILK